MTEEQGQARSANRVIVKLDPDRFSAETDLQIEAMALAEGNLSEALRAYDVYRRIVEEELGIKPSSDMEQLIATVRR